MNIRCAGLNTGPDTHLLDHIAPLSAILRMPLIVTEEENGKFARDFYPWVETRCIPDLEHRLGALAEQFDALFECKYWRPHLKLLFQQHYGKEMRLIFCPHGQSDKGFLDPVLAPYAQQDSVLLYGDLLIEMLKNLNLWQHISSYATVGNYRLAFYQRHKSFYDALAEKLVFSKFDQKRPVILYAPTWRDADKSTSFFDYGAKIVTDVPDNWNLVVKLHPLLEQRDPAYFYKIAKLTDGKRNVAIIDAFPPVYPILVNTDVYLGDFSSVGYDFLFFQRPMFFLPSNQPPSRLRACGRTLDPGISPYPQMEKANGEFRESQVELYRLAFGKKQQSKQIRDRIFKMLNR